MDGESTLLTSPYEAYFCHVETLLAPNEEARLEALRRYAVLDTPPDGSFDRITAIAAKLFATPIALVSLVDEDRIWFKSKYGLDADQIDRAPGLCASAIMHPDVYVVKNAAEDARTLSNPLVAGSMGFRFYAAAPLTTHDGFQLGTLCIIDKEPREFTNEQETLLQHLAAIVMDEMELRLDALRAAARQNEFLALASHELRTPIGMAKAYLELAADELTNKDSELARYVHKADVAIDKITKLITDLLDVSRIDHGKLMLRVAEFDFDALVTETVESVDPITPTHALRVRGHTGRLVKGDKEKIQQVLINLLTNAVKYSPGKADVSIDLSCSPDEVMVAVRDYGIGIAPEHLDKVFHRFHREQRAQEYFPGLGVGLYIAAEITKEHHGRLWAESVPGAGSVFHFSLPAATLV